jgi:hypothetical protein
MIIDRGEDKKRSLERQIVVLNNILESETNFVRVINAHNGKILKSNLALKLAHSLNDRVLKVKLVADYIEIMATRRFYLSTANKWQSSDISSWEFKIETDEEGRVLAKETIVGFREELAHISIIVEEVKFALTQVEEANTEWQSIKEQMMRYRDKYSRYLWRNDYF